MVQGVTIRPILYKSKTLSSGEHPIMLVVTKGRVRKYISLGISCHSDLWNFEKNEPRKNHPKKLELEAIVTKKMGELQNQALELKLNEKEFSSESLVLSSSKPKGTKNVFAYIDELVERLFLKKQVGNAKVYRDLKRVLKAFLGNQKTLTFSDIDIAFLNKFETYFRSKDMSETSISVYFRTLRAVFNQAIAEKIVRQTLYPFKEFKISKFDTSTQKRAIAKEDVQKIAALDLSQNAKMQTAKDIFLFSYFVQGINFKDIAFLRWSNLEQDRLFYNRAKTGKDFNIKISEPVREILERYRPFSGGHRDNFIFPILDRTRHISPIQVDNRIHKLTGQLNKCLKKIGEQAGIEVPLTTYVARHTYATVLKNSGVSVAVISEAMGHKTEAITQTYLKSFENEVIDLANENLL